jgi:predicted dehydrogenase
MTPIRIGIVGCGEVVQTIHLPSLSMLPELFQVTALCDVSSSVVNGVGDQWNVGSRYLDYRDLVASDEVDAVLVTSPHAYHAAVTLAAIAAGKHVLVEKPMCITLREADEIIAAQGRAAVTVQVGYMRRYAPAFVQACQLVRELPEIRYARVRDFIGQNALIINQTSRVLRGRDIPVEVIEEGSRLQSTLIAEAIGDASPMLQRAYLRLLGLSSHDLSAMRELLGMPRGVLYAACRPNGYMSAAFDYGDYVCQFETGVDTIPRFDGCLEVFGPENVLRVDYDTPYVRNLPIRLTILEANGQGGTLERTIHPAWGDPFVVEWQAFHANVSGGCAPKTSPEDFRRDLELFEAMIAHMRK